MPTKTHRERYLEIKKLIEDHLAMRINEYTFGIKVKEVLKEALEVTNGEECYHTISNSLAAGAMENPEIGKPDNGVQRQR